MTAPTLTVPEVLPDMADLPEAPVSPAPVASEHADMWALVQRAQAGDTDAFGQIYRRYEDSLYKFVFYRTGGDHELACEVTSETWARAYKRIDSFKYEGRDIQAWLMTLARNYLFDIFKSGRNRLVTPIGHVFDPSAVDRDPLVDPELVAARSELRAALADAMSHLNPNQRRCIELRFFEGKSVAETAAALGINEGGEKALQWRATQTLARHLPEHYADFLRS